MSARAIGRDRWERSRRHPRDTGGARAGRGGFSQGSRSCERILKQTSRHRDTEALRTEKKGPYLCASVSLWSMQSMFSHLLASWATSFARFAGWRYDCL
jgi:hypothetical protein